MQLQIIICAGIVEMIELSALNSLANDIDVIREVHLLENFYDEARKKSDNYRQECNCPERW